METGRMVWWNGQWIAADEAKVSVFAHALHYGSSVFEGIRAYDTTGGTAVFCLSQHIERLLDSCRIFQMDVSYSAAEIADAVIATVAANHHTSCYIRPLVFRSAGSFNLDPRKSPLEVVIMTLEWGRYLGAEAIEQGVDVMVSSWRRMAPDTYAPMAKIGGQYVNSQFVVMEAVDAGFAEGIALDVSGYLSEGSGENLFLVKDGIVYTPPLASAVLPGITRAVVIQLCKDLGVPCVEGPLPREFIYVADEAFFTGTAAEITPIRSVDRIPIGSGRGPVTARLQDEFFGMTSGRIADRHGWLTYAPAGAAAPVRSSS